MGLFITFEGGEGTGKSTVMNKLVEILEKDNLKIYKTREPGGTKIGERIREILLDKQNNEITGMCEAMLFAASRAQHMEEVVIPALEENKIVLCDRFLDSSLVYQGAVLNVGIENVYDINLKVLKNRLPDITFLFDLDPQVGLARVSKRNIEKNRIDLKSLEFHQKVRDSYLHVANMFKDRIIVIDASKTIEEVTLEVYEIIKEKIKENHYDK